MTKSAPERPPSLIELERIAREQLATIPEKFREHFRDVVICVQEFCDEEIEAKMGLESPFDLLGLYHGVSLDRKSVAASASDLDMIIPLSPADTRLLVRNRRRPRARRPARVDSRDRSPLRVQRRGHGSHREQFMIDRQSVRMCRPSDAVAAAACWSRQAPPGTCVLSGPSQDRRRAARRTANPSIGAIR